LKGYPRSGVAWARVRGPRCRGLARLLVCRLRLPELLLPSLLWRPPLRTWHQEKMLHVDMHVRKKIVC
jgi:hypothetical protein